MIFLNNSAVPNLLQVLLRALCLGAVCFAGAGQLFAHGDYHHVVEALARQLEANPNDPDLHYRMALAHASHDEWELLLGSLDQLEQLSDAPYPLRYLRGRAWNMAARYDRALPLLSAYITDHPDHADAYSERGYAYYQSGLAEEAARDFRRAIDASEPTRLKQYIALARALQAAGQPTAASAALDEGLEAHGPFPSILMEAIRIETANQAWDQVLRRIDAMEAIAPAPEPWMQRRAEVLEQAGRAPEARAAWQRLLTHLEALSAMDRSSLQNQRILAATRAALGITAPQPVAIPPAG